MSISLIAKLKVQPGKEAEFEAAAKEMIATVRTAEPGTLAYILHKNSKDPTEFIYYELYQDQAAFDAHGKTDHMTELSAEKSARYWPAVPSSRFSRRSPRNNTGGDDLRIYGRCALDAGQVLDLK